MSTCFVQHLCLVSSLEVRVPCGSVIDHYNFHRKNIVALLQNNDVMSVSQIIPDEDTTHKRLVVNAIRFGFE